MGYLKAEDEFEELYAERRLKLLWRMSTADRLISVNAHVTTSSVDVFVRQDQPDTPAQIRKVSFSTTVECDAYLVAKLRELDSEGWREETKS